MYVILIAIASPNQLDDVHYLPALRFALPEVPTDGTVRTFPEQK
jgi:hypothetical protein